VNFVRLSVYLFVRLSVCLSVCLPVMDRLDIIYITSCCKSLPALILHVLASFVNSKTIHKLLSKKKRTIYLLDGNSKDRDHSWTYLFSGQNDRDYRMAKRFRLSMPLFALPLTVIKDGERATLVIFSRNIWCACSNHTDQA